MYKQQRQRDVSDVVAETDLENVTTSDDDWMSRRQVVTSSRDGVVRDEVEHHVDLGQVGVSGDVEVSRCETGNCT